MYMIGHQHIRVDSYLVTNGTRKDRFQVELIISSMKETGLTIIASLHNMQRDTRQC